MVALALLISEEATFGAGRVLGAALVAAWCLAALFVALHRPAEPLSILMVVAALIGGFALFGAALSVRDAATLDANDWGAAIRAVAVALLPAVGLHMALGLPDGSLRSTRVSRHRVARLRRVGRARHPSPRRAARRPDHARRDRVRCVRTRRRRRVLRRGAVPHAARTNVRGCSGSRGRSSSRERSPSWSPCCTSWCRGPRRCAASRRRPRCSSLCRWRSARPSASRCASTASSCTRSRWPGSRPWWRRATCSSSWVSVARRRVTSRRCSGCRCSRLRLPRCCGSPSGSGSPTSRRVACTASATRPTRCCARSGAG